MIAYKVGRIKCLALRAGPYDSDTYRFGLYDPTGKLIARSSYPGGLRKRAAELNVAFDLGYQAGLEYNSEINDSFQQQKGSASWVGK